MARIVLFGSAVVGLLVVTIVYAVMIGQYQDKQPASASPVPSGVEPSAAASGSVAPSVSAAASASGQAEPSTQASGAGETVTIANTVFGPDLTIAAGTTVTFMNNDTLPHTATNGTNGIPASDSLFNLQLPIGGSDSYTFADKGSYAVTCTIHPTMNMTITVQ